MCQVATNGLNVLSPKNQGDSLPIAVGRLKVLSKYPRDVTRSTGNFECSQIPEKFSHQ